MALSLKVKGQRACFAANRSRLHGTVMCSAVGRETDSLAHSALNCRQADELISSLRVLRSHDPDLTALAGKSRRGVTYRERVAEAARILILHLFARHSARQRLSALSVWCVCRSPASSRRQLDECGGFGRCRRYPQIPRATQMPPKMAQETAPTVCPVSIPNGIAVTNTSTPKAPISQ